MNLEEFKSWLDLYGTTWRSRNPQLIEDLFADDATYSEKPFEKPMDGIDAIIEYWSNIAKTQEQVQFNYDILLVEKNLGIAHWSASFIRTGTKTKINLDGIFVAHFDSKNKCTKFEEWWQSQKINLE